MALNGSVSVEATPNGRDVLVFSWEATQDKEAQTSTVSWKMELVSDVSGALNVTDAEIYPWAVTLDGQAFSGNSNICIGASETKILAAGEAVLAHEADGTKVFEFTFTQDFGGLVWGGSTTINEVTGTGTGELDSFTKKFPIRDFVNGMIMSLCCSPIAPPKGEPVAFLYGGEGPFPDIYAIYTPELQEQYPFAYMFVDVYGWTSFKAVNARPYSNGKSMTVPPYDSINTVLLDSGEWRTSFIEHSDTDGAPSNILPFWTNFDLNSEDGTVYMAASEPVPIYE